jgi:methylmalonyl-CoA mutase N-terminal domain/subunit
VGFAVKTSYGPEDTGDLKLPEPGQFPYTRGIHEMMYQGRLWMMRQFAGFSTPEETNGRYRYLLEQGQTGLSVAFDLPTLMRVSFCAEMRDRWMPKQVLGS